MHAEKSLKDSFMLELVLPSRVLGSHLLSRQPYKEEWGKGDGERGNKVWRIVPLDPGAHCCDCIAAAFGLLLKQQVGKLGQNQNTSIQNAKLNATCKT